MLLWWQPGDRLSHSACVGGGRVVLVAVPACFSSRCVLCVCVWSGNRMVCPVFEGPVEPLSCLIAWIGLGSVCCRQKVGRAPAHARGPSWNAVPVTRVCVCVCVVCDRCMVYVRCRQLGLDPGWHNWFESSNAVNTCTSASVHRTIKRWFCEGSGDHISEMFLFRQISDR